MPLTKPSLAEVRPGMPITSTGWNLVAGAVEGLYAALGEVYYVEVAVTDRGAPIADARVFAVPLDWSGPALAATPVAGQATWAIVGVTKGKWRIVVQARGFTAQARDVEVDLKTSGRVASASVALQRVTVPPPELVGMPTEAAQFALGWCRLTKGTWDRFDVEAAAPTDLYSTVVMQGPSGGDIDRATPINAFYSSKSGVPSRFPVPDFLGWPARDFVNQAGKFRLVGTSTNAVASGTRVVSQDPAPGTTLPWNEGRQGLTVTYGPGADGSETFGTYKGTHAALTGVQVQAVRKALNARMTLGTEGMSFAPWDFARTYVTDAYLAEVVSLLTPFGVPNVPADSELAAIWRSFIVTCHWAGSSA